MGCLCTNMVSMGLRSAGISDVARLEGRDLWRGAGQVIAVDANLLVYAHRRDDSPGLSLLSETEEFSTVLLGFSP